MVWKEEVGEECPCLLRFLTLSSGCWRSPVAWRSALMSTRLTPWPPSERITLASPMSGCALAGTRPVSVASSPLVNHVDVPSMPPANLSVPEKNQWSREVTQPVGARSRSEPDSIQKLSASHCTSLPFYAHAVFIASFTLRLVITCHGFKF